MPANPKLVDRSGDLKGELVTFALRCRFARAFREVTERHFGDQIEVAEADFANVLDAFILQHPLPDGRTVVEHFVAEHPNLPPAERAMLLGWRDAVEGFFEVRRREGEALVVFNLVDELTYRVRSNMGPAALAGMRPRSFLITRLVPIGEDWLLSGISSILPSRDRAEVYRLAAELATRRLALMFRNPEKLALGWELQCAEHRHFMTFFGSDLVVLPGRELAERMRAYMHFRLHEVRDDEGASAADRSEESFGVTPPVLDLQLPPEMCEADTVGVIYDEVEGLNFYADFGLVEETFANPDLASDRRHRQAVSDYLKEPSISPLPLRRLAERNPERASRVLARVLKQPGFSWSRDGEALPRRSKPTSFEDPILPGVIPVGDKLDRADMAASGAGGSSSGQRPPGRRPRRRSKRR